MRKFVALLLLCLPFAAAAQVVNRSPTSGTPGQVIAVARGVNLNATGDTPVTVQLPPGATRYGFNQVHVLNPSTSITTAQLGVYTGASQGGVTVVTQTALSGLTTTGPATAGSMVNLNIAASAQSNSVYFTNTTLYINVGTPQGSASTADVVITILVQS